MKEKTIENQLSKYFKSPDKALGFYAIQANKPKLDGKLILAAVSPRAAAKVAVSSIVYYILGISQEGIFYCRHEVRNIGEAQILSWQSVDYVKVTEGFMANRFEFFLLDRTSLNFKVLKTTVGLNHSKKTQQLKALLHSMNKLRSK